MLKQCLTLLMHTKTMFNIINTSWKSIKPCLCILKQGLTLLWAESVGSDLRDWLTRPLLGSQRRCHATALYPALEWGGKMILVLLTWFSTNIIQPIQNQPPSCWSTSTSLLSNVYISILWTGARCWIIKSESTPLRWHFLSAPLTRLALQHCLLNTHHTRCKTLRSRSWYETTLPKCK